MSVALSLFCVFGWFETLLIVHFSFLSVFLAIVMSNLLILQFDITLIKNGERKYLAKNRQYISCN